MSSTEQAPEPTMDEILASIRRIIADDDPNANGAAAPAVGEASAPPSPADQIADALGADPGSDAQLDDILELTREIGRQPAPAPVPEAEAPVAPPPLPAADPVQAPAAAAPPPMAEPAPPAPQPQMAPPPAPAAEMPAPQPTQPPEPAPMAEPPTDPAAALEGLLASVSEQSAQQTPPPLPASATSDAPDHALDFDTQPAAPAPEPIASAPQPDPAVGQLDSDDQAARLAAEVEAALGTSQFEPQEAPVAAANPEPDLSFEVPSQDEGLDLSELEDASSDFAELDGLPETLESDMPPPAEGQLADDGGVEPVAVSSPVDSALANGVAAQGRTLEDSVKEMLRPMLREWLDNNMPRILEGAVKEELTANKERDE